MNAARRRWFAAALIAVCFGGAEAASGQETALANGVFLVAKPELLDPNFRETVLLITQPQVGGGPIGVIVNRPLTARLSKVLPGAGPVPEEFDQLHRGGPVARNQLLFLVRTSQPLEGSLQVLADVYLSSNRELMAEIVRGATPVTAFRAYAGYAGWAPGQLQNEIARGGWYVTPADADTIFAADPAAMWRDLVKRLSTRSTGLSVRRDALAVAP